MKWLFSCLVVLTFLLVPSFGATMLPLSQVQEGTEAVTLVENGDFESDTWWSSWNGGNFYVAGGSGSVGGIYPNMGAGTGKVMAFHRDNTTAYLFHTATENKLAPGNYVMSYYYWNLGYQGGDTGWKMGQVRDAYGTFSTDLYTKATAGYENAVTGYFVYQPFTITTTGQDFRLDLSAHNWTNYNGTSGDSRVDDDGIYLAYDNIAITPASQFQAPKHVTKMKLSEIVMGSEQVTLVSNGDFESSTWYNSWGPNGDVATGTFVLESGTGDVGGISANWGEGTGKVLAFLRQSNTGYISHIQTKNNLVAGDYVLSYYVWNLGHQGLDNGWKIAQVRDAWGKLGEYGDAIDLKADGADAVGGYFVYMPFTIDTTGENFQLDLRAVNFANYSGVSGDPRVDSDGLYLAFDNIAITPAAQFVAPYGCTSWPLADITGDCKVDFADFAEFSSQWLDCNRDPSSECLN